MTNYGSDVSTFPVTDMTGRTIVGPRVVAEMLLRRYTTRAGKLRYAPDFGRDVRDLLNADLDETDLRFEEALLEREGLKDERIADLDVTLTLDARTSTLRIRADGFLSDGGEPFAYVLEVSALTAKILEGS